MLICLIISSNLWRISVCKWWNKWKTSRSTFWLFCQHKKDSWTKMELVTPCITKGLRKHWTMTCCYQHYHSWYIPATSLNHLCYHFRVKSLWSTYCISRWKKKHCWFWWTAQNDIYVKKKYNAVHIMDLYKWKVNLTWRCKWIIFKKITELTCWSGGMWLTCSIKFCMCKNSTLK